jgi:hypothetical protein
MTYAGNKVTATNFWCGEKRWKFAILPELMATLPAGTLCANKCLNNNYSKDQHI